MTIQMIEGAKKLVPEKEKTLPFVAGFPLIASLCFACKNYRWTLSIALSTASFALNYREWEFENEIAKPLPPITAYIALSLGVASLFQLSTSSPISFVAPLLSGHALWISWGDIKSIKKDFANHEFVTVILYHHPALQLLLIPAGYSLLRPHTSFGMTTLFAISASSLPLAFFVYQKNKSRSGNSTERAKNRMPKLLKQPSAWLLIGAALVGTIVSINARRHSRSFGSFASLFVYTTPLAGAGYLCHKEGAKE